MTETTDSGWDIDFLLLFSPKSPGMGVLASEDLLYLLMSSMLPAVLPGLESASIRASSIICFNDISKPISSCRNGYQRLNS